MSKKVFRDVKEFTIVRENWQRGVSSLDALLLNPDNNKMCCLGFYAKACKIPTSCINDIPDPELAQAVLRDKNNRWDTFLLYADYDDWDSNDDKHYYHSAAASDLMRINDDEKMSEKDREAKIKEIFKKNGVKVKFVGK